MFHDAVITMKGLILDTKIRSGQAVPKFTRMKIGDGVYDGTEEISESESLKSLRQEFGFSSIEIVDNKTVRLRAISDNEGITDGYYISELGVFAEDPDEGEILYSIAIGVENKMDYQPSEAELPGATCTFDTYTSVSNIETATIMVDLGAAASAKDLDDVMHPEFEDYSEEEAEVPDTSTAIGGIQSKKSIFDVFSFMKAAILGLNRDKVDASGGDIANTTVSEFSKETGEFPDLNPGEAPKTLWGKMKKFVEDFRAWYTGVCLIGHIVNNCTSGATNLPLSALQGKVLMDLYTKLNSDLSTAINGVITLQSGTYTPISNWYPEGFDVNLIARVESGGVSIAGTITTKINFASGDYNLFGLGDYPHGRGAFNDHNIISTASLSHAMIFPYKDDTRYFLIRLFDGVGPGTEFYVCGKALFV